MSARPIMQDADNPSLRNHGWIFSFSSDVPRYFLPFFDRLSGECVLWIAWDLKRQGWLTSFRWLDGSGEYSDYVREYSSPGEAAHANGWPCSW